MGNYGTFALDQNNQKTRKQHISKMNNSLGGQKIDETIDRRDYDNHDYDRQKDNIYLVVNEDVCGEFDFSTKKVKDKDFNSDKALKEYIKNSDYYAIKDAYGRTHKIADDAVLCREFVFVFSSEQTERMKPKLNEWAEDNMEFLKKAFPTFDWVLAVVHNHETSPHMQVIGIPFDEKGKLNNKKFFYDNDEKCKTGKRANGRKTMQEKQDLYYEMVLKKYDLERGVKNSEKHHDELTAQDVLLKQSMNETKSEKEKIDKQVVGAKEELKNLAKQMETERKEVEKLSMEKAQAEYEIGRLQATYDEEILTLGEFQNNAEKAKEQLIDEQNALKADFEKDINALINRYEATNLLLEQRTKVIRETEKKIKAKQEELLKDTLSDASLQMIFLTDKEGDFILDDNGCYILNPYGRSVVMRMAGTELDNMSLDSLLGADNAMEDIDILNYISKDRELREVLLSKARGYSTPERQREHRKYDPTRMRGDDAR